VNYLTLLDRFLYDAAADREKKCPPKVLFGGQDEGGKMVLFQGY
jgi:hypothetical protein